MKIKKIHEDVVIKNVNKNKINEIDFIEIELYIYDSKNSFREFAYYFFDKKNKENSTKEILFFLGKLNNVNVKDYNIDMLVELLEKKLDKRVIYIERFDDVNNSYQKKILNNLKVNLLSECFY